MEPYLPSFGTLTAPTLTIHSQRFWDLSRTCRILVSSHAFTRSLKVWSFPVKAVTFKIPPSQCEELGSLGGKGILMQRTKSSPQFTLCNLLFNFDSTPGPSFVWWKCVCVCGISPVLHIHTHIIYEIWSRRKNITHKTTVLIRYIEYKK